MFWHWQNLNDKRDGTQGSGLRHGRCWWHFSAGPGKSVEFTWNFWTNFCGIQLDWDDEDVTLMLAFPPFAFWLSLSSNWGILKRLLPRRPLQHYPETIVIDEREIGIRIHSGFLWIQPYCRKNEWHSKDSWWARGWSFDLNPFRWKHDRTEAIFKDGEWHRLSGRFEDFVTEKDQIRKKAYPYWYVLRSHDLQHRFATVSVERMAWRPRCLRWTSLIEKVRTYIDVAFDGEVGEKTGSWKGGTIGCSYELQPGETPLQCLRRMERERVFN